MSWMSTWTGKVVYPLDPKPDQICLLDIAHGLGFTCRFNGQSKFYSVAEHSVLLADWILKKNPDQHLVALHALMHDAGEAYLPDIPSPVKLLLPEFKACEERLLEVILEAFGIPKMDDPASYVFISHIDKKIALNEREVVQPHYNRNMKWVSENMGLLPGIEINCWKPGTAKSMFLECFKSLMRLNGLQSI